MDIKVNTIINSLEEFIEAKSKLLFSGNILVNKEELLDYIKDIRTELPSSVTQASAIYQDREKILTDASARADNSIEEAKIKSKEIVDEARAKEANLLDTHELVKKARVQANDIVIAAKEEASKILEKARIDSENMKNETFDFVEEKIAKLENSFSHAKYNAEYLKDEFYKHSGSLFHILSSNIEKDHEDVLANKKAFLEFRDSLKAIAQDNEEGREEE
ncbi:MAG: hypothetical protein Q4A72_06490 [Bacillota bacterium]|nr:hypothetical protein [Bacillota bacterium]